ncbi:hypothetical protein [Flavobacterium agrisoli]|uniref:Uncharacterized protein n=1 Tax=Flavobacterium agrisoli TaxID=2793066 RepID=A0A934PR71_9FLAO|nr:hypothetical protein [Flavobacterium agrisoli]MBK0371173.1 hypothetical protein [Flavobacterium agrisoli]
MRNQDKIKKSKSALNKALKVLKAKEGSLSSEPLERVFRESVVNTEKKEDKVKSLSILTIPEVAAKLNIANQSTAKKWLERNGILIHRFSKQNIVYAIEVICEIDKPFVRSLRLKYPTKWKKIYRNLVKDQDAYDLMVLQLDGEFDFGPTTKVKRNSRDEKLYNDLMK